MVHFREEGNPGGWDNEDETDVIGGGGSGEDEDDDTVETTPLLDPCHITGSCEEECPEGQVKEINGNCVDKPCEGNPVPNPELVSTSTSGKGGSTFGCTRVGDTDCPPPKDKYHDGLDIKADLNTKYVCDVFRNC